MSAEWVIGVIVLALSVVVVVSAAVVFRVLGVWKLAAWCGFKGQSNEEKQVLTKQEGGGYMVSRKWIYGES